MPNAMLVHGQTVWVRLIDDDGKVYFDKGTVDLQTAHSKHPMYAIVGDDASFMAHRCAIHTEDELQETANMLEQIIALPK